MRIGFLFSGQGAQYPGMMKDIAEVNDEARKVFDIADSSLERSISDLCFNGEQEELNTTHNTQPCVLACDLAAYKAVEAAGIRPDAVAGFSLGEYAALVAAGVIKLEDVFPLVQNRADYMQEAVPIGQGAMAAVMKLSKEDVLSLCEEAGGYVVPANYNCPGQLVVSGEAGAVDRLCDIAKDRKVRALKLPVSAPFHCELMESAASKLKPHVDQLHLGSPICDVYMNVDGKVEDSTERIKEKIILQAKSPVYWEDTLRNMREDGIDTFVELGPGKTLSGFVKKTLGDEVRILNVTDMSSLKETIAFVMKESRELD